MSVNINEILIPSFNFAAFYYPDMLEALLEFKRLNMPETTDESAQELTIQMSRAFALVGHLNNCIADLIANESLLPTARTPEAVRNLLRLIDYEMAPATPSQVDVVFELVQLLSATVTVIGALSDLASVGSGDAPEVPFEVLEAFEVTRTDRLTACWAVEDGVYTEVTTPANGLGGGPFTPWVSPEGGSGSREGDSIVFGHAQAMFAKIGVEITGVAAGITGIWEYYDGNYNKDVATSIVDNGGTLTLNLTGYLGSSNKQGTPIRVRLNDTNAYEDLFTHYTGGVNLVTTAGLLGQTVPSTLGTDYTVGSAWEEFDDVDDGSANFTVDGDVKVALPQTVTRNWSVGTINEVPLFAARFRIISAASPTSPTVDRIRMDGGKQYLKRNAIQGQTQVETIGSTDGSPLQEFESTQDNFIVNSDTLAVDDVFWTRATSFLSSKPTDRHYRVLLNEGDRATFTFGDGVNGAIPPTGSNNVDVVYRFGAQDDGNVGSLTVTKDKSGLSLVNKVFNPRPAVGWEEAEGANEASLERAKAAGPASLRVRDVAFGPDDTEDLAERASKIDPNIIAIRRSLAVEEMFGPKTVGLVVVPAGASYASQEQLDGVSEFFNGNRFVSPVLKKRIIHNQELTAVNYERKIIDVTATVYTLGGVTAAQISRALTQLLHPEALKPDGVTFEWDFGKPVPLSRLHYQIFNVNPTQIRKVVLTVPASEVVLSSRQLPYPGTFSIAILPFV